MSATFVYDVKLDDTVIKSFTHTGPAGFRGDLTSVELATIPADRFGDLLVYVRCINVPDGEDEPRVAPAFTLHWPGDSYDEPW